MSGSPNLGSISTRLRRIAQLAREDRGRSFLSLAHNIDEYWLYEAYSRTRKDGAAGIDGQTVKHYEQDLRGNLCSLLERFKSGHYRAPSVDNFSCQVTREWRKWLDRRSRKRSMPWERFNDFLGAFPLPRPKILHAV
jgi:hypothetical protein